MKDMAMPFLTTILSTLLLLAGAKASSLAKRDEAVEPPSMDQSVTGPEADCCWSKIVGPYNYTRVSMGDVPATCLSHCIYTRVGAPGSRFCFARGPEEVHCLDDGLTPPAIPTTTSPIISIPLIFAEGGQNLTQENNYDESTGILEVVVPTHGNYSESRYLVSKAGVLLNTNSSCQLSPAPSNLSQGVVGLPLAPSVLASTAVAVEDAIKHRIIHTMKVSHTRVTASGRKALEEYGTECSGQSITMTDDMGVSDEDYQKLQDGKVVVVDRPMSNRGCDEMYACTSKGPQACGYTGFVNPVTGVGFSFHDVSDQSLCLTCKRNITGPTNFCDRDLCWCVDITDKKSWQDCYMRSKNLTVTVSEGPSSVNGRAKRAAPTVTQTMTFSAEPSGVRSFRLEVPQHTARGRTLNPLTVVMHSCRNGYWNGWGCNGKDRMMFKRKGRCSITNMPEKFYPFDGAVGMNEVRETLMENDTKTQHSILLDVGEINVNGLAQSIQDECSSETPSRRVVVQSLDPEQTKNLTSGGVAFIQTASKRGCEVMTAATNTSDAECWYWPNPGTGEEVFLHNVIDEIEQLQCCRNTIGAPGPCCDTQHPDLCLCDDITNKDDFKKCLDGPVTSDVLLVAAGSPSATDYTSDQIQLYERHPETGVYSYAKSKVCNQILPQKSTFGVGAVVTSVPDQTILFCEGYTAENTGECRKFKQGEGFQEWDAVRPKSLNLAQGHSVMTELDAWGLVWWIFPPANGGTINTDFIKLDGSSRGGPKLPEPLNMVCVLEIENVGIFLSGIPTTGGGSNGNKNWLYISNKAGGSWKPLPESKEKRSGGSCGVFHPEESITIVMAGGFLETMTSSEKFNLTRWLDDETSPGWVEGPDVGEARWGATIVSMRKENEIVLVGGISQKTEEVFSSIKVLNGSSDVWAIKGALTYPVYSHTALAVPKTILKDCF